MQQRELFGDHALAQERNQLAIETAPAALVRALQAACSNEGCVAIIPSEPSTTVVARHTRTTRKKPEA